MSIAAVNDRSSDPFDPTEGTRSGSLTDPAQSGTRGSDFPSRISKVRLWTGRCLTALATLFLLFDAVGKLVMPPQVVQATTRLGFPMNLIPGIGVVLLICTALYVVPRTAVLGAVLVTGFLGGAVAVQMRAGSPLFETLFPVIFGVLVWSGIYLRECRLCALLPIRH